MSQKAAAAFGWHRSTMLELRFQHPTRKDSWRCSKLVRTVAVSICATSLAAVVAGAPRERCCFIHGLHGRGRLGRSKCLAVDLATELEYVLPVGPSSPFRSAHMEEGALDRELGVLVDVASRQQGAFAQMAQQRALGMRPDSRLQQQVGGEMLRQAERLKKMLDAMESSADFQALETYHMIEARAQKAGTAGARAVQRLLSWQGSGLIAESEGKMPPPPPEGIVDAEALEGASALQRTPQLMGPIFSDGSFSAVRGQAAESLEADFHQLVADHEKIVELGENYGKFDSAGKEYYLAQVAEITRRWHELMLTARQVGVSPTQEYKDFSEDFLRACQMTPLSHKDLVEVVHYRLKEKAQADALRGS